MKQAARLVILERCAVVVLGLYLAGSGLQALLRGAATYSNWLRWPVAAPLAIVLGVILVVAGFWLHRD